MKNLITLITGLLFTVSMCFFAQAKDDDDVINKFKPSIANGAKDLSKNTLSWKVYKWRMGKRMKKMLNA